MRPSWHPLMRRRLFAIVPSVAAIAALVVVCSRCTSQHPPKELTDARPWNAVTPSVQPPGPPPPADACRSDQVPYYEAGCVGPPKVGCWPNSVHPTPGEWCGCNDKTFGGSMPTQRFRFEGPCEVSVSLEGSRVAAAGTKSSPGDAAPQTLSWRVAGESSNKGGQLGQFEGVCRQEQVTLPVLMRVVCRVSANEQDEIEIARDAEMLIVRDVHGSSGSPATKRELARIPAPARQSIRVLPFTIAEPLPVPTSLTIGFGFIPTPGLDGRPNGTSAVDFYWPLPSSVGHYEGTCRDQPPIAPALIRLQCGAGSAALYELTVTREGQELVLTQRQGTAPARTLRRFPIPPGVLINVAGTRHD